MRDARQLARVVRVRAVQHRLAQADEAKAHDKAAAETRLATRIAQLAADVGPVPGGTGAIGLAAAAHYRARLHQSAAAAEARRDIADAALARAVAQTQEARRDEAAAEKLLERARAEREAASTRRLLDGAGATRRRDRHDPC